MSDADDFRPEDPKIQTEDDLDTDRDGVSDGDDFRPEDPKVQTRDDIDTDRDGTPDYKDDFPKDAKYAKDTDGDGVADPIDDFPKDTKYSTDTDGDGVADSEDAFPGDPSRSKVTLAMENALGAAQNYLDLTAFSRLGLIGQLSSQYGDGYSIGDATWAVDQLNVDWNEQAVKAGKNYLDSDVLLPAGTHRPVVERLRRPVHPGTGDLCGQQDRIVTRPVVGTMRGSHSADCRPLMSEFDAEWPRPQPASGAGHAIPSRA